MRFFAADDDRYYPVSSVHSYDLKYLEGGKRRATVSLQGGGARVQVNEHEVDALVYAGDATIPAQPGFFYMGLALDEGSKFVWLRPIVAWIVPLDDAPVPITVNGARDGVVNDYVVVQPNGSVIDPKLYDYDNVRACVLEKGFTPDEAVEAHNKWRRALHPTD